MGKRISARPGWTLVGVLLTALVSTSAHSADKNVPTPELHRLGMTLYKENCAICHGPGGAGDGSLASEFSPPPRDFTIGEFRFTSTGPNQPPARLDIANVIKRGIEGSYGRSMPAFPDFSSSERLALSEVVRQFAGVETYGQPVEIPPAPAFDPVRSEELFESFGCSGCHGSSGRGDGPSSAGMEDTNGAPLKPANFTVGKFKGGERPEDVWLRVYGGIAGTPMPSFGTSAEFEDLWAVTQWVLSFRSN
jgi:cytochrome c oxidase cbb3-type subunit 2